jgi:hypothetical protein
MLFNLLYIRFVSPFELNAILHDLRQSSDTSCDRKSKKDFLITLIDLDALRPVRIQHDINLLIEPDMLQLVGIQHDVYPLNPLLGLIQTEANDASRLAIYYSNDAELSVNDSKLMVIA